jgi:alkanesulfonate monooxygenase SsuD/methylene tetrahydromethanopterin reductase-like flavin-dependent oxidoreductase (luciferase family)
VPDLERGLERGGRTREHCDVIAATLVVTAADEDDFARVKQAAREQLAFYGSTPAYRPTLDCHGWGDLHPELNALSKQGRWTDMAALIDDDVLETIAVVGPPHTIAAQLVARFEGITDGVSITNNRAPDPGHWATVVADLHAR